MSRLSLTVSIVCEEPGGAPEATLDALAAQSLAPDELLVLCSAGAGALAERIHRALAGWGELLCAAGPLAGAPGRNVVAKLSGGDVLVCLEPGLAPGPGFLEHGLAAFDDPRVGLVGGLIVPTGTAATQPSARGAYLSRSRRPLDAPIDAEGGRRPVLSAPLEAAFYSRRMLDDVADEAGPFDEALEPAYAALELGWRAWRAGWEAWIEPAAVASLPTPPRPADPAALARTIASRHLSCLRHDRLSGLLTDAPFLLAGELRAHAALLRAGPARLWRALREGALDRRRARQRRRSDAARRGLWGPWSRELPPRGVWRGAQRAGAGRTGGS